MTTTEYIDGTDAAELLKADGPLDPDLAPHWSPVPAGCLDYAWRKRSITHRAVKSCEHPGVNHQPMAGWSRAAMRVMGFEGFLPTQDTALHAQ